MVAVIICGSVDIVRHEKQHGESEERGPCTRVVASRLSGRGGIQRRFFDWCSLTSSAATATLMSAEGNTESQKKDGFDERGGLSFIFGEDTQCIHCAWWLSSPAATVVTLAIAGGSTDIRKIAGLARERWPIVSLWGGESVTSLCSAFNVFGRGDGRVGNRELHARRFGRERALYERSGLSSLRAGRGSVKIL